MPDIALREARPDTRPPDLSQKLPPLNLLLSKSKPKTKQERASSPPPPTPALDPPLPSPSSITYIHPTRRILSPADHTLYLSSPTHSLLQSFTFHVAESVRDTPISAVSSQPQHPTTRALLAILDKADALLADCPATDTGSRFGNPAFRTYIARLTTAAPAWYAELFADLPAGARDEVVTYFCNSFGSAKRIDYGSGHELHYLVAALCLYRVGALPPSIFPQLALVVFPRYLKLMRSLQTTYYLEPAGSHGVWGLDDYHFLPFLFGAAQLRSHRFLRPLSIHNEDVLEAYADEYLYLDMVRAVNASKTVQGLRWHSPMLDDISGVRAGWGKIEGGMRKMFVREVLEKLVVMQHFLFGGLVAAVDGMKGGDGDEEEADREEHEGHMHNESGWGDCCGIKVPSAVGAVEEMRKRNGAGGLRRLPFD